MGKRGNRGGKEGNLGGNRGVGGFTGSPAVVECSELDISVTARGG